MTLPLAAFLAANPASVFCGEMGGQSVTATLASGDEIGLCVLPGDKIVEEWTLLRMFDGKVPAPASNRTGPSSVSTASRCAGFSPSR